jgi:hypothetical protein
MTGVVLALVATLLAGYALVRPLVRALPRSERFAWSLAAGLLIEAFVTLVFVEVRPGSDLSAPLSLSTVLLLLPLLRRRPAEPDAPKTESLAPSRRALVALAAAGVALFALAALSEPMWSTDYLAIWGLKGKTIFLTASVPARLFHDRAIIWSRWDYPLLLPLDLAALAAWARGWEGRALALLYPLCHAATAAAAFGFFARRGQALRGAIAAALIAWFFPLYAPVNVGTVEVPLALGFVLLSTALLDVFELGTAASHARLALASLYCAAMKPEGTLFAVLAALLWVFARPPGRARATPLAALLLPPALHAVLMQWARGSVPVRDYDITLLSPSRWGELLGRIGEAAGRIASTDVAAAAVPLAALAAFLALSSSGPADRLLPILTVQAACYLLACSLSAFGAAWLAAAAFGRIVGALVPALALVLGARAVPLARGTEFSFRAALRASR